MHDGDTYLLHALVGVCVLLEMLQVFLELFMQTPNPSFIPLVQPMTIACNQQNIISVCGCGSDSKRFCQCMNGISCRRELNPPAECEDYRFHTVAKMKTAINCPSSAHYVSPNSHEYL